MEKVIEVKNLYKLYRVGDEIVREKRLKTQNSLWLP